MVPGEPFSTLLDVQQLEQAGFSSDEAAGLLLHCCAWSLPCCQFSNTCLSRKEERCMKSARNLEHSPSERARVKQPEEQVWFL
jgi:hypothetical protein